MNTGRPSPRDAGAFLYYGGNYCEGSAERMVFHDGGEKKRMMEGRRSGGGRLKRLAEVLYPVAFELSHAGCQPLPTPKGERAHHVINEYEKHMERGIINER